MAITTLAMRGCAAPKAIRPSGLRRSGSVKFRAPHTSAKTGQSFHPRAAEEDTKVQTSAADKKTGGSDSSSTRIANPEIAKEINKLANTMAPRQSGQVKKNPAVPGSTLYKVFDAQAWIGLAVGGLLSFNLIYPSDEPSIARLMGMWSIWMFTIPALRARECEPHEKEALNILFLAVPLVNITLPFIWKSFAFVYTADVITLFGIMYWKGWWDAVPQGKKEQ